MKLDEHIDVIAKVGEVAGKEYAIEEVTFSGLVSFLLCGLKIKTNELDFR